MRQGWDWGGFGIVFGLIGYWGLCARAATLTTLASFDGWDGVHPVGNLLQRTDGNFYGTAIGGGMSSTGAPTNFGTIYEFNPKTDQITNLASFSADTGAEPEAGLIADAQGNLYGTTRYGGSANDGTIFEYTKSTGTISTLATFLGSNGSEPTCTLYADGAGDLYGTTTAGGANNEGTFFEWSAATGVQPLYSFHGSIGPVAGVVAGPTGSLYGAGPSAFFQFNPASRTFTILSTSEMYSLNGLTFGPNGNIFATTGTSIVEYSSTTRQFISVFSSPPITLQNITSGLLIDAAGNMFGTEGGGNEMTNLGDGVFESTITKQLPGLLEADTTLLDSFGSADGYMPYSGLTADSQGELFGVTANGGSFSDSVNYQGYGTIYEITNSGFVVPEPASMGLAAFVFPIFRRRR